MVNSSLTADKCHRECLLLNTPSTTSILVVAKKGRKTLRFLTLPAAAVHVSVINSVTVSFRVRGIRLLMDLFLKSCEFPIDSI